MNHNPSHDTIHSIDMQRLIRVIFHTCLIIIVLLIIFDYVFNYLDIFDDRSIRRIWNIAREQSLPTWFSSIEVQLMGVTIFLTAAVLAPSVSRWKTTAWILTGLFFLWIGIDDFAEIHEKLGGALERMAAGGDHNAVTAFLLKNPSFSWHTFIAPFFIVGGLCILAFLWVAFWRLKLIHYLILGFGCWAIAQGLDFVEGLGNVDQVYDHMQALLGIERRYGITHLFKVVEEVLEMLGSTLLWVGFLNYFAHVSNGLHFTLEFKDADGFK